MGGMTGGGDRSADAYLSWQDLLDEEAAQDGEGLPREAGAGPDAIELPADIKALLAEKERLERELRTLTGQSDPSQEDERLNRMFPVKVHTKETRLEERRQRRRDEERRLLEQRTVERRRMREAAEVRRAEQEAERQRAAAAAARLCAGWERQRAQRLWEDRVARRQHAAWSERQTAIRLEAAARLGAAARAAEAERLHMTEQRREANRRTALEARSAERREFTAWEKRLEAVRRARAAAGTDSRADPIADRNMRDPKREPLPPGGLDLPRAPRPQAGSDDPQPRNGRRPPPYEEFERRLERARLCRRNTCSERESRPGKAPARFLGRPEAQDEIDEKRDRARLRRCEARSEDSLEARRRRAERERWR
jgi:hypothetical protein